MKNSMRGTLRAVVLSGASDRGFCILDGLSFGATHGRR